MAWRFWKLMAERKRGSRRCPLLQAKAKSFDEEAGPNL